MAENWDPWGEYFTEHSTLTYTNSNHNTTLVTSIKKTPPDFVIKLRTSQKFPIHKEVMALVSDYFEASSRFHSMSNEIVENCHTNNPITELSLDEGIESPIQALVDYAYTGSIYLNCRNVADILKYADYFLMEELSDVIITYLLKRLDFSESSSRELLGLSKSINNLKLHNSVVMFLTRNFYQFYKKREYLSFKAELLVEILSNDKLVMMEQIPFGSESEFMFVDPLSQEVMVNDCIFKYAEYHRRYRLYTQIYVNFEDLSSKAVRFSLPSSCTNYPRLISQLREISNSQTHLESLDPTSSSELQDDGKQTATQKPRDLSGVLETCWSEMLSWYVFPGVTDVKDFDDSSMVTNDCPVLYIVGITVYRRTWLGREVISGMRIKYSNFVTVQHGDIGQDPKYVDSFSLGCNERVINVLVSAGWLIESISFETNQFRGFGPGANNPWFRFLGMKGLIEIQRPCPSAHLVFVKGKVVRSFANTAIQNLQFGWVYNKQFRSQQKYRIEFGPMTENYADTDS